MLALGLNDPYVSFHKANCDMVTQLPKNKITIGTTFSGIGAPEEAMRRLNINHEVLFACDIDNFVKQSYFANYEISAENWYNDVCNIDGKKYKGKLDLLVGGLPSHLLFYLVQYPLKSHLLIQRDSPRLICSNAFF